MILILISITLARAQYEQAEEPTGLETIKVGNNNVTVPKGTRIYKKSNLTYVESINEYAGRRFEEMEMRLGLIERNQNELKYAIDGLKDYFNRELQQLKREINDLQLLNKAKIDKVSVDKEQASKEYGR
jgi:hypothetical protein